LRDTRTPLRFALARVALTAGLGYLAAFHLPGLLGVERRWGVAGIALSSSLAGWVEFGLLRRSLNRRIGVTGIAGRGLARLWVAAGLAAAAGWGARLALPGGSPLVSGLVTLLLYGATYVAAALAFGVPEARWGLDRLRRRAGSRG
jgi:putative peptidoglycan lipid II flippase